MEHWGLVEFSKIPWKCLWWKHSQVHTLWHISSDRLTRTHTPLTCYDNHVCAPLTHVYAHEPPSTCTSTQSVCTSSHYLTLKASSERMECSLGCHMSTATILIKGGCTALAALPLTQHWEAAKEENQYVVCLLEERAHQMKGHKVWHQDSYWQPHSWLQAYFFLSEIWDTWWRRLLFCIIYINWYDSLTPLASG
jgi:hypothetical protein